MRIHQKHKSRKVCDVVVIFTESLNWWLDTSSLLLHRRKPAWWVPGDRAEKTEQRLEKITRKVTLVSMLINETKHMKFSFMWYSADLSTFKTTGISRRKVKFLNHSSFSRSRIKRSSGRSIGLHTNNSYSFGIGLGRNTLGSWHIRWCRDLGGGEYSEKRKESNKGKREGPVAWMILGLQHLW